MNLTARFLQIVLGLVLSVNFVLTSYSQTVVNYSFTGNTQTFTVPPCVANLSITLKGAQGGNNVQPGGYGGLVKAVISVTPGQVFYIEVGEQPTVSSTSGGYNGGGNGGVSSLGTGKGGGGGTDVRFGGTSLSNRILVAGGGGGSCANANVSIQTGGFGGGGSSCSNPTGMGGGGGFGGTTGGSGGCSGGTASNYGSGGAGGGLTSGGALTGLGNGGFGQSGSLGQGGNGGDYAATYGGTVGSTYGGGGGGGGYYGGAGGMGVGASSGGGGGGSSYANNTLFSNISFSSSSSFTGNGAATIEYAIISPVSISIPSTVICSGSTLTLTAGSSSSYTWSIGSNNATVAVSPTTNVSYTVSGTNSLGCVSSAVCNVSVNAGSPTLSINSSTNQICLGNTITLTAGGALTYSWSNGILNGQAFTPSITSNYLVTGVNACGQATAITSVSVNPVPVTILATSSVICAGLSTTLSAVSSATAFNWLPTGGQTQSLVVSPGVTTIFTAVVNNGVCTGRATYTLSVVPSPTITSVSSSFSICEGNSVTLSASGATSYTWNPGSIVSPSVVVSPSTTTQYSVSGINTNGCLGGTLQIILVQPKPILSAQALPNLICQGSTSTLTVIGANSYTWNTGASTNTLLVNPGQSTTYSVSGTFSSSGCSNNTIVNVMVFNPSLTITGNTSVCLGQSASLTAVGASNYTWSNGFPYASIVVTPTITTQYSVSAISYSGNLSCNANASINVLVNPNPLLLTAADRTVICKGESVQFSVTGADTYTWSNQTYSSSITLTPSQTGIITLSVTGSNLSGCTGKAVMSVSVLPCTSLLELNDAEQRFKIYPNPAQDWLFVETLYEGELRIYNQYGQLLKSVSISAYPKGRIQLDGISPGLYLVEMQGLHERSLKSLIIRN